jgi:hypothetical protein
MASILSVRGEAAWPKSGSPQHSDSTEGHFPPANHATVNGTFSELAAVLPDFSRQSAWICDSVPEICVSLRTYGTELLTMIKNVLIAAISFVSLNQ